MMGGAVVRPAPRRRATYAQPCDLRVGPVMPVAYGNVVKGEEEAPRR